MKRFILGFLVFTGISAVMLGENTTSADVERPALGEIAADTEAKNLEGTWEIVAAEIMGKKIEAPKGKGGSIVFGKGMKVVMKDPGKPDKDGKYKIDTSKSPKQLDLIERKDGKDGKVTQAIYEVDGDTLRLAFSGEGPKGKRPTEFKGEKVFILHLKRQKS